MTKLLERPLYGFFMILLGLSVSFSVKAQDPQDYAVHANIIYRFTKYIDWPQDKKTGDFVIGIVGETPLYEQLKEFVQNRNAGTQKIVIKKFRASSASFSCHILFIPDEESGNLKNILTKTADAAILLVSESDGLAKKGSCINFIVVQDHLKLEINKNNIQQRRLSVATELLSLGKMIK